MHRALPAAALGAAVALLAPALAAPGPAEVPAAIPWDLIDCQYAIGLFVVEAGRLAPYLPQGFRGGGSLVLPAGLGVAGAAQVALEVDSCRDGAGLHGRVPGMQYASLWVAATAPEELNPEGLPSYVNWDVLVPDADRRAVLQEAGLPARAGRIDDRALVAGFEEARRADVTLEGLGAFTMLLAGPPADLFNLQGSFVQFTPAAGGGLARWRTDYASHEPRGGAGVVVLDPGSWIAEVAGSPVVPARFFFGTWDYTDGVIEPRVR